MIGEMYSPEGEELAIHPVIGVHDTRDYGCDTLFIVYSGNITDEDIPYMVYEDYETKQVARISMIEAKYFESDIKIPDENIKAFNDLIHKDWKYAKSRYDFITNDVYDKHKPSIDHLQCPDYSTLNDN